MTRTLLPTALLAALMVTTAVHAQSLADAAKKAAEARTKAKQEQVKPEDTKEADKASATKVYTNKDLVDVPTAPAAAGTPTVASNNTAAPADPRVVATPAVAEVKDEAWWRSHALVFRRTLADDITKLAAAQAYYDGLPDQARGILGTPVVTAWMNAREEIARLTGVVANDKRALADFEQEARRAGIAPGWLREK